MTVLGTPFSASATKVLLCGAGELGKEVAIEFQRLGCEVIALDRYDNAPAMQVADRSYTLSMLDGDALAKIINDEKPDYIIPEIEAIATDTLAELEQQGFNVIPSARATQLTMNREGIRRLAAEKLLVPTSPYIFADNKEDFIAAVKKIDVPCVVKPIMSSSGKGQSTLKSFDEIDTAWEYAQEGGRAGAGKVIVEGFVDFDYEITLLTIRHIDSTSVKEGALTTSFCQPIGHRQENGDYQESWQPQAMSEIALQRAQEMAEKVTTELGGCGLFGVELFIKGDEVIFSEVSPRPHDTGLVTLISQDLSEFALHARAILGLPIPNIVQHGASASAVLLVAGESSNIRYSGLDKALAEINTQLRLFGKPEVSGQRRMGVALARGTEVGHACRKALAVIAAIKVEI
ncbi:phosphoribosylglycinamide formyltransferase 2 [Oleispira antarctica]|uniref:Formate-dependent phosphoribosylglycinamide formyltransferase n=1 Tax=Oleispira antarctica TaxID=188908 RepID=A0A1Y5HVS8_OLEAN|nr:phosphoribosylglycinamide formyltransferase 2 [Oleispira antarctica]